MAISAGDAVWCYNAPNHEYVVEQTDVARDIDVDAARIWRLPDGDTLLRATDAESVAVVAPSDSLRKR